MNRAALRISFVLAALAFAPAAWASDPFPGAIQMQLMLAAAPACTLCHQTLIGGLMTVTKPFGRNLQQKYQLRAGDVAGLRAAIVKMQMSRDDDVDGDGVLDIDELIQGTDPNVPNEGGITIDEGPRHGCYCSTPLLRSKLGAAGAAWLFGLTLAGARRRAMRRSRRALGAHHVPVERKS